MAAAARRGDSRTSDQAARMGIRNQAWILVSMASDQTAPAPIMAGPGRRDRRARSPARSAAVQVNDRNVSSAPEVRVSEDPGHDQ